MNIELTQEDIDNLLAIIDNARISGAGAELIVNLKSKLKPKEETSE
jgi:hypothetical protein